MCVCAPGHISFYAFIAMTVVPLLVLSFARLYYLVKSGFSIEKFEPLYLGHGKCGSRECGATGHNWSACRLEGENMLFLLCDSGVCCYTLRLRFIICIPCARAEPDCPVKRCLCQNVKWCGGSGVTPGKVQPEKQLETEKDPSKEYVKKEAWTTRQVVAGSSQ